MIRLFGTAAAVLASATCAAQTAGSISIGNGDIGVVASPPPTSIVTDGLLSVAPVVFVDFSPAFNASMQPPIERDALPVFRTPAEIVDVDGDGVRLPEARLDTVAR